MRMHKKRNFWNKTDILVDLPCEFDTDASPTNDDSKSAKPRLSR